MKYEIKEVGYEEHLLLEVENKGIKRTYAVSIYHSSDGSITSVKLNGKEIDIMEIKVIEILLKENKIC